MEKEGHEVAVAAIQSFDYIDENVYSAFADGHSIHTESMRCQCQFSQSSSTPDSSDDPDDACGEQCINRLLFVECLPAFCPVGEGCLNRRFQKREYAPVDIFLTAEKGYGLKAKQDIAKYVFCNCLSFAHAYEEVSLSLNTLERWWIRCRSKSAQSSMRQRELSTCTLCLSSLIKLLMPRDGVESRAS
eukprot:Partr_v1_DN28736_c0_g2_i9_m62501 putative SET domain containing 2